MTRSHSAAHSPTSARGQASWVWRRALYRLQFITQPTGHAFPTFNFLDGSITNIGQDRVGTTLSKTYEFTDNFTIIKHNHTMRFGFDTRRVLYNALMYFYASDDYGQFNFTGSLTGYSLGDFLLGAPQSNFADIGGPQVNAYAWHWGVYGQDEWQVNSHLTVNFGLRWELQPAMTETNGDLANFVPSLNAIVVPDKFSSLLKTYGPATPAYIADLESFNGCALTNYGMAPDPSLPCTNVISASQAGLPPGLRHAPLHDFDPRVSIAYRPFNNDKDRDSRGVWHVYDDHAWPHVVQQWGDCSFASGQLCQSLSRHRQDLPVSGRHPSECCGPVRRGRI